MSQAKQSDLFGQPTEAAAPSIIDCELHLHNESDKAWLLSKTGMERDAKWIPKSLARRHPHHDNVYTMARPLALERGWL